MREDIKKMWEDRPLLLIVLVGLFFRTLAVIFSKGFGMLDDHFLIIEASQSWVDGYDYDNWLPSSGAISPKGYSMFYTGIHYLIFSYLKWRGMLDPQAKMYIIRALHALWSLLVIIYGYKITKHYAGRNAARQAGMILSILWFMPMLSVRNLIEVVCIPPLMIATWAMIDPVRKDKWKTYLWAGFLCGIAFNIRFQSAIFIGGVGLVLLFQKQWRNVIVFGLMFLITVFAFQGVVDMFVWHRPFAELTEYIRVNYQNANAYTTGAWYQYIGLIAGALIPPVSLFIIFGFMRSWKKYPMLFWPSFLFFAFHSAFPNKQERFIAPVIPFIIVLGIIGWTEYVVKSKYWQNHPKFLKGCWTAFWILNCIPLPFISTMYSKKSRVEPMTYLSKQKDLQALYIDESYRDNFNDPPLYYLGNWKEHIIPITTKQSLATAYSHYKGDTRQWVRPNYIMFVAKDDYDRRLATFQKMYPDNQYMATITPSFIDNVLTWLNPVNNNQTVVIYRFTEKGIQVPADTASGH